MSDTGTPRPPWGLGKSLTLAAVVVFGLVVVLMLTVDTTPPASATEPVTEAEPEPVTEAEPSRPVGGRRRARCGTGSRRGEHARRC